MAMDIDEMANKLSDGIIRAKVQQIIGENKALESEVAELKGLLGEANEALMSHPLGLCNRISKAIGEAPQTPPPQGEG